MAVGSPSTSASAAAEMVDRWLPARISWPLKAKVSFAKLSGRGLDVNCNVECPLFDSLAHSLTH